MITLDVWLPQILNYCRFVADDNAVKKAWVDGDLSDTSISSFSELYEQVFDDLDSDNFKLESAGLKEDLVRSIGGFLASMHQVDAVNASTNTCQSEELIASTQWYDLKNKAVNVLANEEMH